MLTARTAYLPSISTFVKVTALGPKNFYLISDSPPVTLSTTVRKRSPFWIPIWRISYSFISQSLIEEGTADGKSLIVTYSKQLSGSRERTLTVVSSQAKNRNLYLNLPSYISPISIASIEGRYFYFYIFRLTRINYSF